MSLRTATAWAVEKLQRMIREPGLLEIVVGFGRLPLVQKVLRTPRLRDEREPLKLQNVLNEALRAAAADPNFDLDIVPESQMKYCTPSAFRFSATKSKK